MKKRYEITLEERKCAICFEVKKAEEFPKNAGLKGGLHCYCKKCSNKKQREAEYYKTSNKVRKERRKNDPEFRDKLQKQNNANRKKNIITQLLHSAKTRAVKKDIDFTLIKADIVIPEICPILNIEIVCGNKYDYSTSPSIDRLDNSKGYTKDNIQIISMKANTMKNSASIEELLLFANWINQTFKK